MYKFICNFDFVITIKFPMKEIFKFMYIGLFFCALLLFSGCKKPESLLKIYVRDSNTKLVSDARVSIYSDENSTPTTEKHNDKAMTNSSGFVTFDLNSFFVRQSEKSRDGYFYINASKEETEGSEQIRVTYQTTSVQTVYLNK